VNTVLGRKLPIGAQDTTQTFSVDKALGVRTICAYQSSLENSPQVLLPQKCQLYKCILGVRWTAGYPPMWRTVVCRHTTYFLTYFA
jgi:hypothetical protein